MEIQFRVLDEIEYKILDAALRKYKPEDLGLFKIKCKIMRSIGESLLYSDSKPIVVNLDSAAIKDLRLLISQDDLMINKVLRGVLKKRMYFLVRPIPRNKELTRLQQIAMMEKLYALQGVFGENEN